ncbi:MAG: GGDEF domain-containing protein [Desulfobacterales bacterium]|nr:GGDEF domain-containing protein [Desulfobacterales bacterium]MBF0397145.1 GGDEF domain-containing protein [Desulfobacterales bacterium]
MDLLNQLNIDAAIFEAVQTGIVIINKDFHIVCANLAAKQILAQISASNQTKLEDAPFCYNLLFQKSAPCEDCPINDNSKPWPRQKSITLKKTQGDNLFIRVQFSLLENNILLTLHDVTQEVTLLRKIDLMRKEQQAKNVLLERRRQNVDEDRRLLEQLLNHLPEAIVTVNASFFIQRKNKAVNSLMPSNNAIRCHELLGKPDPCENCPAEHGFGLAANKKKSHQIGSNYLTETIAKSPFDEGGLLIFRETTREIKLIGKIREQQETITRNNEILSKLVDLGNQMQKETDASFLINSFLDMFLPIIKTNAAGVIINDIRAGNLWFTAQRQIDNDQMGVIARSYLSRDVQSFQADTISSDFLPWEKSTQKVLIGADGKRVGLFILKGDYCREDNEYIKLFIEPLGGYIHNKLLLKQLEERAYTDGLTGLYNRRYLDQALKEEEEKLKKYNIDYSIVAVDVNRLKMANDVYGHEAGDKLLLTVSQILKKGVRPTDIVARTGGDEFFILLTNTKNEGANSFISRLQSEGFNNIYMEVGNNEQFPVTVSLGAAGTDVYPVENLQKEADRFMYESKEAYYKTQKRYR